MVLDSIELLLIEGEVLTPDMDGVSSTSEVGDRLTSIMTAMCKLRFSFLK